MAPDFGPVKAYLVCYLAGILLHSVIAWAAARRLGLRGGWWQAASASYVLGMIVGARLLFDLTRGLPFAPLELLTIDYYMRGGLWGGPLVHLALIAPAAILLARRPGDVLDLAALAAPLPMAVAKLGCFLHGCCYGVATALPWGVTFPANCDAPAGVPLHPTQLYEAGVLAATFALLARLPERWRGSRLAWFLLLYGAGRGLIEFARGDAADRPAFALLTVSQAVCLAAALAAGAVLVARRRGRPGLESPGPTASA